MRGEEKKKPGPKKERKGELPRHPSVSGKKNRQKLALRWRSEEVGKGKALFDHWEGKKKNYKGFFQPLSESKRGEFPPTKKAVGGILSHNSQGDPRNNPNDVKTLHLKGGYNFFRAAS